MEHRRALRRDEGNLGDRVGNDQQVEQRNLHVPRHHDRDRQKFAGQTLRGSVRGGIFVGGRGGLIVPHLTVGMPAGVEVRVFVNRPRLGVGIVQACRRRCGMRVKMVVRMPEHRQ
jgi:hypothetical protein